MTNPSDRPLDHEALLRQAMQEPADDPRQRPSPPRPEDLAARFPDYAIQELIGRGGMGAVYRAVQRKLDRVVALKVLPAELADKPEFGERFLREARALASLNHPHVLTVHDFGEVDGGIFYLVTEYVDGVNLRQLMDLGELSPAEALRITPQICQALQYAHEQGVVHRDIKPENILIDRQGQVKIADFGLAKLVRPGEVVALTRSTAVFGTPHYMAPEQWRGSARVDHRADIYSLGVVLYEMLTGQLPLGSYDPPSHRHGVPPGLDEVVRRTLAQQPENRYQSAREVETDVDLQARGIGPAGRPSLRTARAPATSRVALLPFLALAVLVLALLGAFLLFDLAQRELAANHHSRAELAAYSAELHRLRDVVQRGQPWTEALPTPPFVMSSPTMSTAETSLFGFGAAIVVGLLVMLLGFWSIHRIRAAAGALHGLGLAVCMAWLVPLVAAGAVLLAPLVNLQDQDLASLCIVVALPASVAGGIAFLVWETRRQRALVAARMPPPISGVVHALGVCLTLLLAALLAVAFLLLPRPVEQAVQPPRPTEPATLVGEPMHVVLERLGPPSAITASADTQGWTYFDTSGKAVAGALLFSGGSVAGHDASASVLVPNERPERGPYPGQRVSELIEHRGQPARRSTGTLGSEWLYPDGLTVLVQRGIVIGWRQDG